MNWNKIKLRDLEKAFYEIFKPEELYGEQAIVYDEALSKSKHFGTTWKQEMQNVSEYLYLDFITNFLEEQDMTPDDFNEN